MLQSAPPNNSRNLTRTRPTKSNLERDREAGILTEVSWGKVSMMEKEDMEAVCSIGTENVHDSVVAAIITGKRYIMAHIPIKEGEIFVKELMEQTKDLARGKEDMSNEGVRTLIIFPNGTEQKYANSYQTIKDELKNVLREAQTNVGGDATGSAKGKSTMPVLDDRYEPIMVEYDVHDGIAKPHMGDDQVLIRYEYYENKVYRENIQIW